MQKSSSKRKVTMRKIRKYRSESSNSVIENAHRTGKKGSKPRHIIVRVYSRLIKRQIMITAKDKLKHLSCHLIEDLTHSDYLLKGKEKNERKRCLD